MMGCEKGKLTGICIFSVALFVLFLLPLAIADEVPLEEVPVCIDIDPITQFHDGDSSETLVILGGSYDTSTKILVPMDLEVEGAYVDIAGEHIENEPAMDIVIVNDISGSMEGSLGNAQEDAKEFTNILLSHAYNSEGLVTYETTAQIRSGITKDKQELLDIIDTYVVGDRTCTACGIVKGTELLRERGTPFKAMIIMTNANSNWCTYGVCTPEMAKKQAVSKAEEAWYAYGIRIYTIPYTDSTDTTTLEKIANVSHGKFYDYGTSMDLIYSEIESNSTGSPSYVSLDIGSDGDSEFSHAGVFLGTETVDFTSELVELLACECDGCEVVDGEWWGECLIDFKVTSATTGLIIFDNLMITGCLNQTTECTPGETRSCPNQEGVCEGSQETCPESGFWSGICDYSGIEGYEDPEVSCDNMDNDCDGATDEGVKNNYYFDNDNDGYGAGSALEACYPPEGYKSVNNDCNDNNPNVHPGATEACNGVDDDCDGTTDEGCGGGGGGGGGGHTIRCGDRVCEGTETCETCVEDCGECCEPSWSCSEWGDCFPSNIQTRECTDANNCGTRENIPSEIQTCTYSAAKECGNGICETGETCETCEDDCGECPPSGETGVEGTTTGGLGLLGMFTAGQVTGGGILALLLIALILVLLFMKRKKKKK